MAHLIFYYRNYFVNNSGDDLVAKKIASEPGDSKNKNTRGRFSETENCKPPVALETDPNVAQDMFTLIGVT